MLRKGWFEKKVNQFGERKGEKAQFKLKVESLSFMAFKSHQNHSCSINLIIMWRFISNILQMEKLFFIDKFSSIESEKFCEQKIYKTSFHRDTCSMSEIWVCSDFQTHIGFATLTQNVQQILVKLQSTKLWQREAQSSQKPLDFNLISLGVDENISVYSNDMKSAKARGNIPLILLPTLCLIPLKSLPEVAKFNFHKKILLNMLDVKFIRNKFAAKQLLQEIGFFKRNPDQFRVFVDFDIFFLQKPSIFFPL